MKTKYLFLSVLMLLGMLLPIASTAFSRDTSTEPVTDGRDFARHRQAG